MTGSYDCTCKVWSRTDWSLLHTITLHTDSVWEIKLKQRLFGIDESESSLKIPTYTFATAGLDGTVGLFHLMVESSDKICLEQVWSLVVLFVVVPIDDSGPSKITVLQRALGIWASLLINSHQKWSRPF